MEVHSLTSLDARAKLTVQLLNEMKEEPKYGAVTMQKAGCMRHI